MAQDELTLLIKSRHPIVVVECDDEVRLLAQLADSCATLGLPLFTWSVTDGIRRSGSNSPVYETLEPVKAFAHVEVTNLPAVYAFRDSARGSVTPGSSGCCATWRTPPRRSARRWSCRVHRSSCRPSFGRSPRTGRSTCRSVRS